MLFSKSGIAGVLLAMCILGGAFTAQARQGFYLGAGYSNLSASGDLDGSKVLTNSSGTDGVLPGKLSSGSGFDLDLGYNFNKYIGVEYLFAQTHHTATTTTGLSDTTADVSTALLGLRGIVPINDNFELFARLGVSSHTVKYADYGLHGSVAGNTFLVSSSGQATFTGSGTGYGIGAEYLFDHVGVEAGYTVYQAKFDQASTSSISGSLGSTLNETFGLFDLSVLYHF